MKKLIDILVNIEGLNYNVHKLVSLDKNLNFLLQDQCMKGGENITFPTAIFSAGNLKFYPTFHAEDRATFRMRICGGYVVDMPSILHIFCADM